MLFIVLRNLLTPFNLINAGIIGGLFWLYYSYQDERLLLDSVGVGLVVSINTLISIVQEWRAKRTLERVALEQHKTARVIRQGAEVDVERDDIAVDDVLVLRRGSAVVVDGVITRAEHLEIEKSLINGESTPELVEVGEEILSGSVCVAGYGEFRATRVGNDHTVAGITRLARSYVMNTSPLQRSINRIFEVSFAAAIVLAAADVALNVAVVPDVDLVRRVATLLLGLIPEGLVFFTTVTLILGVYRISKQGVFVQKLNAVESFSTVDTVCMDKTGTITENKLSVHSVHPLHADATDWTGLLKTYALTSVETDQTTRALAHLHGEPASVRFAEFIPFSSARKWSARRITGGPWMIVGAPELLSAHHEASVQSLIAEHHLQHFRLLVAGYAESAHASSVPTIQPGCVIALHDAVREESIRTFGLFKEAGVDVRILTGDAQGPTLAALSAAGINVEQSLVIRGSDLDAWYGTAREQAILDHHIFVRLRPEHKREIVSVLQRHRKHVAMVGDGVNDLPAIKEAHVGIAVSGSAEATKEVADIVLENQTVDVFPDIIAEGRSTLRTVLHVGQLYIGKNLVLLAMSLLATLTPVSYPLTPRRGALLSVVGVGIPAMVLAATSGMTGRVRRFIRTMMLTAGVTTAVCTAATVVTWFVVQQALQWTEQDVHTCMMAALIGAILGTVPAIDRFQESVQRTLYVTTLLVGVLLTLLTAISNLPKPLSLLATFYEINATSGGTLPAVLTIAVASYCFAHITHRLLRINVS